MVQVTSIHQKKERQSNQALLEQATRQGMLIEISIDNLTKQHMWECENDIITPGYDKHLAAYREAKIDNIRKIVQLENQI